MFKFIRQYAEKVDHASLYPTVGLIIFMVFFIVMVNYVRRMTRQEVDELSSMPLDLEHPDQSMNL
jgi:flagellar biosynthesis/type III secretory pathway M-ring protein FliF/YscJ